MYWIDVLKINLLLIYILFIVWYYLLFIGKIGGYYKYDGFLFILDYLFVILFFFIFFKEKKIIYLKFY